ncbi:MAG: reticulon family protein [Deltaproteobacteria bacterium]|jgi:hypothetical protein|nr:reticulon family protein [Deltaproteobacteria bacterium]
MITNNYIKVTIIGSFIIGLFVLYFLVNLFNYGFDTTDEASYLQFISYPDLFNATMSQYGFLYNLLFKLTNFNIPIIRLINFITLFIFTFIFNYLFICKSSTNIHKINIYYIIISFILSFSFFSLYTIWLPTPNYNLLNFNSIIITIIGMSIVSNNAFKTKYIYFGWIIIGLGGWLTFLAKPTTAAALGLMVLIWVAGQKSMKFKLLFISIFTSLILLFLTALYIDGSIDLFIERYKEITYEDNLAGTHSFATIITINLRDLFRFIFKLEYILFFILLLYIGFIISKNLSKISSINVLYVLFVCSLSLYIFICKYETLRWYALSAGHLTWAPALGAIIHSKNHKSPEQSNKDTRCDTSWTIFLALLPLAYSLGSNNSIFCTTAFASFFVLLAFLTHLRRFHAPGEYLSILTLLAICSQFISIGILYTALANPYRQQNNIWEYKQLISIQTGTQPVYLPDYLADYLTSLHKIAENNNFQPGNTFIDLSGKTPGAAFALKGLTPGTPWIFSGYPGSQALFSLALKKIPCHDLAKTWLLWSTTPVYEPLNPFTLHESGLDPSYDFEAIGVAHFPIPVTDKSYVLAEHFILKPRKPYNDLLESCKKARAELTDSMPYSLK